MIQRRRRAERGQVTAFVVALALGLLLFIGLAVDGGRAVSARLQALDQAQQAARVGAQMLNTSSLHNASAVVDPSAATTAARAYLAAAGSTGQVTVNGGQVSVTVSRTVQTFILGIVGMHTLTVSEAGSTRAENGVVTPR